MPLLSQLPVVLYAQRLFLHRRLLLKAMPACEVQTGKCLRGVLWLWYSCKEWGLVPLQYPPAGPSSLASPIKVHLPHKAFIGLVTTPHTDWNKMHEKYRSGCTFNGITLFRSTLHLDKDNRKHLAKMLCALWFFENRPTVPDLEHHTGISA